MTLKRLSFVIIILAAFSILIFSYRYNHYKFDLDALITSQKALIPPNFTSLEDSSFNYYYFNTDNIPKVHLRLINYENNELSSVNIKYTIVEPFSKRITKYGTFNSSGSYNLELIKSYPNQEIWLWVGDFFYSGIIANKSLYIELDFKQLKKTKVNYIGSGVKYSDNDGELNSIINKHRVYKRFRQEILLFFISNLGRKNISYERFLSRYNFLYSHLFRIDNLFFKENPSDYSWAITNERLSYYFGKLRLFHRRTENMQDPFNQFVNHKPYFVSNNSNDYYQRLFLYYNTLSDQEYRPYLNQLTKYTKLNPERKNTLDSLASLVFIKSTKTIDSVKMKKYIQVASDYLKDTLTANRTIHNLKYIDNHINKSKADLLKTYYIVFTKSDTSSTQRIVLETTLEYIQLDWCKNVLRASLNQKVENRKTIFTILNEYNTPENILNKPYSITKNGARLYIIDTLTAPSLLKSLKNTFAGKAILIDFWATWCSPCLTEMTYSKNIQEQLKDQPIEFIYLCTSNNSTIHLWEDLITKMGLGGTHLYVNDKITNNLMELLNIGGFPNYVLIDKNGLYKPGTIIRMSTSNKDEIIKTLNE